MYRRHHRDHTAHGNIAAPIWLACLFLLAYSAIAGITFITNKVKENTQANEGLYIHTQWNAITVLTPKEGYRINYFCLAGESKMAIENVIKIIPEDDTVFTPTGNYQINDNCIRQIIKDKQ